MEEIKTDFSILKEYLFKKFAFEYFRPIKTIENETTTFSFSLHTKWYDVISSVIDVVSGKGNPIIMSHRCSFDLISDFFNKELPLVFVKSSQYWELVNELTEKIHLLIDNGYSNIEPGWAEEAAKFILAPNFEIALDYKNEDGGLLALFYISNEFDYKEYLERLICNLELKDDYCKEQITGMIEFTNLVVSGLGKLALIKNAINHINTYERKPHISTQTYFAIDDSGLVKIGRSDNWKKREYQLKTGNANAKIILVLKDNMETELHKKFYDKQYRGEWYMITKDDIISIMNSYNVEYKDENIGYYLSELTKQQISYI